MKRFLLIFSVLFYLNHITVAQDICATVLNLDSIEKHNPTHYKRIFQIEKHVEQYLELLGEDMGRSTPTTIRIPVVVHVSHNGEPAGTGLNIGSQRNSENVFGR